MNALFIFAHPDDAEIYSGGLLAKLYHKKEKIKVCCVSNKQKDKEYNEMRESELYKSMEIINVIPDFMNIEDGKQVWTDTEIKRIENYIQCCAPDIIITHNKSDYHYDHRHLSQIVYNIASYQFPMLMSDTLCGNMHEPSYFCDITKYMTTKLDMISCYKSQLESRKYIEIVKILNAYRALQYGGDIDGFCEGYSYNSNYHQNKLEFLIEDLLREEVIIR